MLIYLYTYMMHVWSYKGLVARCPCITFIAELCNAFIYSCNFFCPGKFIASSKASF